MVLAFGAVDGRGFDLGTDRKVTGEIQAAQELVKVFNLKGKVLTGDAGFCYKIVAEAVAQAGGDWVFALKGNPKTTLQLPKDLFADDNPTDFCATLDHGHGRVEIRTYQTHPVPSDFAQSSGWKNVRSFVKVVLTREIKDKTSTETRYYLTSLPTENQLEIADYLRSHWSIENNFHWRLDLVYREDSERSRTGYGPENLLILRRTALNAYGRATGVKNVSIRAAASLKYVTKTAIKSLNFTKNIWIKLDYFGYFHKLVLLDK